MKKILVFSVVFALAAVFYPAAASSQRYFALSQDSFTFYYVQGGGLPTNQSMTMTNITGTSIPYTINLPNKPSWLNESYNTNQMMADPNVPNGIGAAVDPTGMAPGVYSTALFIIGNFSDSPLVIPITLSITAPGTSLPANVAHPEGANVKSVDGTVYRIMNGTRNPYTSAGAFLSYGYNSWADVQLANAADMAMPVPTCTQAGTNNQRPCYIVPRDGSLINDQGTIYIITDNYRIGFASAEAFLGLGYSFGDALVGDTSFLTTLEAINTDQIAHPSGTVVNDKGTICVIESPFRTGNNKSDRKCFSKLSDMNSWGIRSNEILMANSYDRQLPIAGIIAARTPTSMMNP